MLVKDEKTGMLESHGFLAMREDDYYELHSAMTKSREKAAALEEEDPSLLSRRVHFYSPEEFRAVYGD